MFGFVLGTVAAQFAGAWVYLHVRGDALVTTTRGILAASAAGLVTGVIATAIYIPLGVHTWLGGPGTPRFTSAFVGFCAGLCQAVLLRGRPLRRRGATPK